MMSTVLWLAKVVEGQVDHSRKEDHLLRPKIKMVVQFLSREFLVVALDMKEWITYMRSS